MEDDAAQVTPTAIPWRSAFILLLVTFAEGCSMNFYTTITALMMTYQFDVPSDRVGFYVGYFATAFYIGQVLSNFPLSWLSDRIGRKFVLLGGLAANIVCQICFGMSKWLWVAIGIRFLNGMLNCSLPVTKCFVRETSDVTNQGRMFSFREVGFSIGAMVAPLLGSIFARPADQAWFKNTFFASGFFVEYPYALVCYVASCIDIICLIIGIVFMRETLQHQDQDEKEKNNSSATEIELEEISNNLENEATDDIEPNYEIGETKQRNSKEDTQTNAKTQMTLEHAVQELVEDDIEEKSSDIDILIDKEPNEAIQEQLLTKLWKNLKNRFSFLDQSTVVSMILYVILSFTLMIGIQTFPVWASRAPEDNGLNFEERQLGILNSVGAASSLIFQLLFFTPIDSFLGCTVSFRVALVVYIPVIFVTPFLCFLYPYHLIMWGSAVVLMGATIVDLSWSFGEINVMINNAARSDSVGSVNGLSTALAALARIVAPVFGTSLFAWSANLDWYYPFNYMMVFHLCSIFTFVCLLTSAAVPSSLNRNRNSS